MEVKRTERFIYAVGTYLATKEGYTWDGAVTKAEELAVAMQLVWGPPCETYHSIFTCTKCCAWKLAHERVEVPTEKQVAIFRSPYGDTLVAN